MLPRFPTKVGNESRPDGVSSHSGEDISMKRFSKLIALGLLVVAGVLAVAESADAGCRRARRCRARRCNDCCAPACAAPACNGSACCG